MAWKFMMNPSLRCRRALVSWLKRVGILAFVLYAVLLFLLVVFVAVMRSPNPTWAFEYFGECDKFEILKFLGICMGGILFVLQVLASQRRSRAMEDTVRNAEQGQRQERLKNAIEHLGHTSRSVRMGGAYELFHLAEDTPQLRQTVFDILCGHIRRTTSKDEYRKRHKSKPSEEVQSLLTLLFVQHHTVFKGLHIDLNGSWLNGANLWGARLTGADLTEAHLRAAFLRGARLLGALLRGAHLQSADLNEVRLQGSILHQARLQAADMKGAWLQGASLGGAGLQSAELQGAEFGGANVWTDHLTAEEQQRSRKPVRDHQWPAKSSLPTFAERIRKWIGKEGDLFAADSKFSGAKFEGGLSQEDVDSLVEGLSDNDTHELREKLQPHLGKPTNRQLSQDSGASKKPYGKKEADQWIAEYEEAMSEIRREDG